MHASWPTTQLIGKRTMKYGTRKLMEKLECSLLLLQKRNDFIHDFFRKAKERNLYSGGYLFISTEAMN